jgi:hypothetical protein
MVMLGGPVRKKCKMDELRGTNSVRIKRSDLIAKLKENRDNHAQLYKDALEGYFVETKKKLEQKIKTLEKGETISSFSIAVPKDHTKDYDRLISMLEMSIDDELEITSHDFNNYVLDEWINEQEKMMLRGMALSSSNAGLYK